MTSPPLQHQIWGRERQKHEMPSSSQCQAVGPLAGMEAWAETQEEEVVEVVVDEL